MDRKSKKVQSPLLSRVRFFDVGGTACLAALGEEFDCPVPVEISDGSCSAEDITLDSVGSGLIKAIASGPKVLSSAAEFSGCSDKEMEEVMRSYIRLLGAIYPDIEKRLALAGMAKMEKGDLPFAEEVLLALKNMKGSVKSYLDLAQVYGKMAEDAHDAKNSKAWEDASDKQARTLHEGLGRNPGAPSLLLALGAFHLGRNEMEIAVDFMEQALLHLEDGEQKRQVSGFVGSLRAKIDHDDSLYRAFDQIMMDKSEEALATIEEFLKTERGSWEGWYVKGWALRCLDRCAEAKEALLASVSRNPDISAAYNELALCERKLGNAELAKEYLEMALDREEDNVIYLANLAYLHLAERDFDGAKRYLDKARTAAPEDNQVLDLIDEYEALSGETLGPAVVEESCPREEVERLESHTAHEEI